MSKGVNVPNYPGAAKIDYVYHSNGTEQTDITLFVNRIDIHSDINMVATRCHVQINDFENAMAALKISAGDLIAFNIIEGADTFERRYKIAKISDIVNFEDGRAYKLILVSELEYASFHVKISKHFVGKSNELALGILDNYTREGSLLWEESTSVLDFIVPMWSPLKTLKWIANKSRSSISPSKFVFFQNSKQFWNFVSLPFLKTQHGNNVITYTYNKNTIVKDGEAPDTNGIRTAIQNLDYIDSFDIRKEIQIGNIATTDFTHDLTTKTFYVSKNSYWDTYASNALNPKMQWHQEEMGSGKTTINTIQKNAMSQQEYAYPNDEVSEDMGYGKGQQLEIAVYGNSSVDIGQIVNIDIPTPQPHTQNLSDRLDRVWSGKYYVVAKHDAYDKTGHTMALRLAKDSFI